MVSLAPLIGAVVTISESVRTLVKDCSPRQLPEPLVDPLGKDGVGDATTGVPHHTCSQISAQLLHRVYRVLVIMLVSSMSLSI
jgi:hypothetical protein